MKNEQNNEWFQSAFSHDYIRIYAHRSQAEAQHAIRSLLGKIELPSHAKALDLCCGFGRHLGFLREMGIDAVGCDLSLDLLQQTNSDIIPYIARADMRRLPYRDSSFEQVFSFFTSFGYFEDDAENGDVIQEIARVLKSGGGLLMDFLNPAWVRSTLVPEDEQAYPEFTVRQERWIDDTNCTVNKRLTVCEKGEERTYLERVKLYGLTDFQKFFDAEGIELLSTMGAPDGTVLTDASPRMIMIGSKR